MKLFTNRRLFFWTLDRASSIAEADHGIVAENRPVHCWQLSGLLVWSLSCCLDDEWVALNKNFNLKGLHCYAYH